MNEVKVNDKTVLVDNFIASKNEKFIESLYVRSSKQLGHSNIKSLEMKHGYYYADGVKISIKNNISKFWVEYLRFKNNITKDEKYLELLFKNILLSHSTLSVKSHTNSKGKSKREYDVVYKDRDYIFRVLTKVDTESMSKYYGFETELSHADRDRITNEFIELFKSENMIG